jgi:hypothetical protein
MCAAVGRTKAEPPLTRLATFITDGDITAHRRAAMLSRFAQILTDLKLAAWWFALLTSQSGCICQ